MSVSLPGAALHRSPTILLAHGDAGARERFGAWLRASGYIVHEASRGVEALAVVARTRFDLVLLDVDLPDVSGMEVCRRLKSARATASIPVMMLFSEKRERDLRAAGLDTGADGHLPETIDRDMLLASVVSMLRLYEPRRAAEHFAARLEQLHQATLLMNAAPNVRELMSFASTGLAGLFSARSVVLFAREGTALLVLGAPNEQNPSIEMCELDDALRVSQQAAEGDALELGFLERHGLSEARGHGAPIMTPNGTLVGAVILLSDARSAENDLMLDHFAQAFAVALENQRLYDAEHQIALTLQQAMLPQSLPGRVSLDIAVRYRAASDTVEIGGDFYEVIALDEHRTLLAIGDVMGHSLRAATVMAELRYSLRAFASIGTAPSEILARLDRMLCEREPLVTATLCLVEVDTARGRIEVTNAGHIPPLVARGASWTTIEAHGVLLGAGVPWSQPAAQAPFGPGDVLVLATDGLVERRGERIDDGLQRLRDMAMPSAASIEEIADAVLDKAGPGDAVLDDIAIVVARRRARGTASAAVGDQPG